MINFIKYFKIISVLCFVSISNLLFSANYYVAEASSGDGSGVDASNESATIQNIFDTYNLASGDIINVAAGTYTEKGIIVGADDEGFTIQGAALSGDVPTTIFDSDQSERWLALSNNNNDGIIINNIYVKDYKPSASTTPEGAGGGVCAGSYDISSMTFSNCIFDNCDVSGTNNGGAVYFERPGSGGGNSVWSFTDVEFKNCQATKNGGAVFLYNYWDCNSSFIRCDFNNNNITSSGYFGYALYVGAYDPSTLTMTNCLMYKNTAGGSVADATFYTNNYITSTIYHCTIYSNTCTGCGVGSGVYNGGTMNMYNCISMGHDGKDLYDGGTFKTWDSYYSTSTGVSCQTTCYTGDPLFVNAASDNYHLTGSSPCIDNGYTSGAPADDYDQFARDGSPDVGAFEYGGAAPLPISLVDFKATLIQGDVLLTWSTFSERNNDYFTIEKTLEGERYTVVGTRDGFGSSNFLINYSLYDFNVQNTLIYYRLKQIDFDGNFTYSNLISIDNRHASKVSKVGVYNVLGQEVSESYKGMVVIVFSDGSSIKKFQ